MGSYHSEKLQTIPQTCSCKYTCVLIWKRSNSSAAQLLCNLRQSFPLWLTLRKATVNISSRESDASSYSEVPNLEIRAKYCELFMPWNSQTPSFSATYWGQWIFATLRATAPY